MLLLLFEGALFRFSEKTPAFAPLFQLPPRLNAAISTRCDPAPTFPYPRMEMLERNIIVL